MENSGYKVVSNRTDQRKKFFIAFISFALALGVVIAIFSLTLGRRTEDWMDGTAGYSRSTAFPYPFISGRSLYVLRSDRSLDEVDNNVKDAVYDPAVNAVYYIYEPTAELYEYSVNDRTRVRLCAGVDKFSLFKDRTHIAFSALSGDICVYSYNSRSVSVVRSGIPGRLLPQGLPPFYTGESSIYFFDEFDESGSAATLKQWKMSGAVSVVSEGVDPAEGVLIWKNDSAVSFTTESGLCVCPRDGTPAVIGKGYYPVLPLETDNIYSGADTVNRFDSCAGIRYLCLPDEKTGAVSLYSVSVSSKNVKTALVAENVSAIVGYDDSEEILIYKAGRSETEISVFRTRKGGKPQELFFADLDSELFFEPISNCVYIMSKDGAATRVDIFDSAKTKYLVSDDAAAIRSYYRKPFVVLETGSGAYRTIVINKNVNETYNASETRLYGKSDNVFLLLRTKASGSSVSLDFSNSGVLKRISGDCVMSSVVFDKKIENVIYYGGGTLYLYSGGENFTVGTFSEVTVPVPVFAY